MPQKFWFVWNSTRGGPTKRHPSLDKAATEAARLAALHPGHKLYVLEAIGYAAQGELPDGTFGPVVLHKFKEEAEV